MSWIESFSSSLGENISQLLGEGRLKQLLRDEVQHHARSVVLFKTRMDKGMAVKTLSTEWRF